MFSHQHDQANDTLGLRCVVVRVLHGTVASLVHHYAIPSTDTLAARLACETAASTSHRIHHQGTDGDADAFDAAVSTPVRPATFIEPCPRSAAHINLAAMPSSRIHISLDRLDLVRCMPCVAEHPAVHQLLGAT